MLMDKTSIMKRFLRKLVNLNIWGEKITDEAVKELVRMEFITTKQSTEEIHISLNSKKQQEIYDFIKDEE